MGFTISSIVPNSRSTDSTANQSRENNPESEGKLDGLAATLLNVVSFSNEDTVSSSRSNSLDQSSTEAVVKPDVAAVAKKKFGTDATKAPTKGSAALMTTTRKIKAAKKVDQVSVFLSSVCLSA